MQIFPHKVIGIDLHDDYAELVELRLAEGDISLESYNRVAIDPSIIVDGKIKKSDELKIIISELLKGANPKAINEKEVAVILPANKTLTHVFTFPASLTEDEVRKTIPYEAESLIPFSIEDVYWDIVVLKRDDPKKKHASQLVLFSAVSKETSDEYATLLESMTLSPFLFGVSVEALQNALKNQVSPENATLVIEFGPLSTNYLIIKNNTIQYFYSANAGGVKLLDDLSEKLQIDKGSLIKKKEANWQNMLREPLIEAFLSKRYARASEIIIEHEGKEESGPVTEVLLTGEFMNLPNFFPLAKATFPNQRVTVGDPKTGLDIDSKKFLPLHQERGEMVPYSTYFINAIGVALRALRRKRETGINLLPDRLKQNFSSKRSATHVLIATIGMCMLSLITAGFYVYKQQTVMYERASLEAQKATVERTVYGTRYQEIHAALNVFNEEILALSTINNNLFSIPKLIGMISETLPNDIQLTSIQFSDEALTLNISGIAADRESLLALQGQLEQNDFVDEVIAPISNYDEKTKISFTFELKLNFISLPPYGSS